MSDVLHGRYAGKPLDFIGEEEKKLEKLKKRKQLRELAKLKEDNFLDDSASEDEDDYNYIGVYPKKTIFKRFEPTHDYSSDPKFKRFEPTYNYRSDPLPTGGKRKKHRRLIKKTSRKRKTKKHNKRKTKRKSLKKRRRTRRR